MFIPPIPASERRATAAAPVPLRFEDVTQDGRLVLEALPNALSPTLWRGPFAGSEASRALASQGIVPILTRLRLAGTAGPFSAAAAVDADASFRLGRADDGRFMLDMWADLHGPLGRTYGSVDRAGERVLAGRVFAEHVLTRPFAPDGDRRVTNLSFPGAPVVTATRAALPPFATIATLPESATPLEPALRFDTSQTVFGLTHTDSNRHVNSLVYLRLFEEAALRRFAALGRGTALLARSLDIAYRKPRFVGQAVRIAQQAFESEGRLGVVAVLVGEEEATDEDLAKARPSTYVRLEFEP